jgi:hypothetical protein
MEFKGYNLNFFRESANGDIKFMKYIMNLTARELGHYFGQFAEALKSGNKEQANRTAHKLRPHLEALQASEIAALLNRLLNDADNPSNELLQAFQQKAMLLCNEIQQAANDER